MPAGPACASVVRRGPAASGGWRRRPLRNIICSGTVVDENAISRRPLLRRPITPSVLSLGCAQLGNLYREVSDADARATVDAAWNLGVRYFDTAPHYGLGLSERRLGTALVDRPR